MLLARLRFLLYCTGKTSDEVPWTDLLTLAKDVATGGVTPQ
jgi:hypothetical protein